MSVHRLAQLDFGLTAFRQAFHNLAVSMIPFQQFIAERLASISLALQR